MRNRERKKFRENEKNQDEKEEGIEPNHVGILLSFSFQSISGHRDFVFFNIP